MLLISPNLLIYFVGTRLRLRFRGPSEESDGMATGAVAGTTTEAVVEVEEGVVEDGAVAAAGAAGADADGATAGADTGAASLI